MSWVWNTLTIPANTPEGSPAEQSFETRLGDIKGIAVLMEGTVNEKEAGVRLESPEARLFPSASDEANQWLYSTRFDLNLVLPEQLEVGATAPARYTLLGFNTTVSAITVQVGIQIDQFRSPVDRIEQQVRNFVAATKRIGQQPDIEKQIRRIAEFIRAALTGQSEED